MRIAHKLLILGLGIVVIALVGVQTARANEQIRVGKAQGTAWTFLPVDIGIAQGFFAQQGLDIDSADLGGDAKVQQALAAGSIDIGLGSGPGLAFVAKGSPGIGVAAFAGPPRNISAIVLEDSPIKAIADLKGKLIAVSSVGSLSDWLATQMAIQEGWGQDGIGAVPLGAVEISIAALKAKQVDAVVLSTEAGFGSKSASRAACWRRWIATRRISLPTWCSRRNPWSPTSPRRSGASSRASLPRSRS